MGVRRWLAIIAAAKSFGQAMTYVCRAKGVRIDVDGGQHLSP
jgi:hypothetical protein